MIPKLVNNDVELVMENARIVLVIDRDNHSVEIRENKDFCMNIIAVIGPSFGLDRDWERVLLLEIGISYTRPYHRMKGVNREPGQLCIPHRRKWFYLTPEQYQLVAPIIFKKMEIMAYQVVSSWKSGCPGNRFLIPASWRFLYKRSRKTTERDSVVEVQTGIRFSASAKDELLVRDIYRAELFFNKTVKDLIYGLARVLAIKLNFYRNYWDKLAPDSPKGFGGIKRVLEKCYLRRFPHLRIEVVRALAHNGNQHWSRLADMIGWDGKDTKERKLALLAMPDTRFRFGDIQILVTTSFDGGKDYIVFEVQK